MPKYRHLTSIELEGLEKEFIDFLVLNGIVSDDWEKLKSKDPGKASTMIDLFSDVVFEGVLRKTMFLEWRSTTEIRTFQCLENEIVLIGLIADENSDADFLDESFLKNASSNPPSDIKVYTTKKGYKKTREEEIYQLIEAGAEVSDGKLFESLALAL